jgi:phage terminase large subunit-like protein
MICRSDTAWQKTIRFHGIQSVRNEPKAATDKTGTVRHSGQFIVLNSYMISALSGKNDGDKRVL